MSNETLNIKFVDNHFRFLKNLDPGSKKKLIAMLTRSIEHTEPSDVIDKLYGAWKDSRNANEIIEAIRKSRINSKEVEDIE
jgi:hypothetical protein